MSLIIHKNAYQDFFNLLLQLQSQLENCNLETEIDINQALWLNLNQLFKTKIIPLTDQHLTLATASRWISLHAEIQREFRLLNTDWLFFTSSRQLALKKARKKTFIARLNKLINYCQTMLTEIDDKLAITKLDNN